MMRPPKPRVPIGIGLVIGVVALAVVTAALVHIPWSLTARANVSELALQLNEQLIENVRVKMSALLDDAVASEKTLVASLEDGTVDIRAKDTLESLFLSFIRSHPNISAIEFGWLDDRSIAVRRLADDLVVGEETTPDDGISRRRTTRYEIDGDEARRAETWQSDVESGVTQHFWFKHAFEARGVSWSDIYRHAETGRLGFTAVRALMAPNGEIGVLATSVELNRISRFLGSIDATDMGTVFLTNSYAELVALGNGPAGNDSIAESALTPVKLDESDSTLVRVAAEALAARGLSLQDLKGAQQIVHRAKSDVHFVTMSPLSQMGLVVGLVVPESEILGRIDGNTRRLAYVLLVFVLGIAVLVTRLAARTLARPLGTVTRSAAALGDFRFDEIVPVSSRFAEISALSQAISQMSASLASFKKYVPTEVVRTLFAQGVEAELGGARRNLTIFFMDLANFTQIAEAKGEALIPFLGEFLSEMSDEIREGGGTIDKYIGDAIMAFWGAPVARDDHALLACRTALACQKRLENLRARNPSESIALRARIGINTGSVLVGNVGSRDRLNYTAIGDPVNVAARLEPLNKLYGSEILIGENTYVATKDHIVARRLDRVAVYGKSDGVEIFELLAIASEATPQLREWVTLYERGVEAFRRRAWDEAERQFETVMRLRGGEDVPSRLMIDRINELRRIPPPQDWDGSLRLSQK